VSRGGFSVALPLNSPSRWAPTLGTKDQQLIVAILSALTTEPPIDLTGKLYTSDMLSRAPRYLSSPVQTSA